MQTSHILLEKYQTGDKLRISKFLSSKNIGSRKDIEKLIMEKRISLNGVIITTPITFVDETDLIYLDNRLINTKQKFEILKYYKPTGFITSHKKQDKRPIIFENLPAKFRAFNWDCEEVTDGHSFDQLVPALREVTRSSKPRVLVIHTIKGKGIKAFERDPAWHARKIKGEDLDIGRRELGLT